MFDLLPLIQSYGPFIAYILLFAVIFAETGLLFGFFLPGDSLLFSAGILASQGFFNIGLLCVLLFVAAVTGNVAGYYIGKHIGKRLFNREDSLFFHKSHLERARKFYEEQGGKTIILARFMPIIRTFAPVVAGMSELSFPQFLFYSVVGGILWAVVLPIAGFFLGRSIPDIDHYLLPIIGLIVVISLAPAVYEAVKTKERRQKIAHRVRTIRSKRS